MVPVYIISKVSKEYDMWLLDCVRKRRYKILWSKMTLSMEILKNQWMEWDGPIKYMVSNESLGKEITVMKCHEPFGYESEHVRTIYCTMANSKTAAGTFGGLPPKPHIEKPLANSTALPKIKKKNSFHGHHIISFLSGPLLHAPSPSNPGRLVHEGSTRAFKAIHRNDAIR